MQYNMLIISTKKSFYRYSFDDILYIEADGNYSMIHTRIFNYSCQVPLQLGDIEKLITEHTPPLPSDKVMPTLIRVGKSLIINTNYVAEINLGEMPEVKIKCQSSVRSVIANGDALKKLKDSYEKNYVK